MKSVRRLSILLGLVAVVVPVRMIWAQVGPTEDEQRYFGGAAACMGITVEEYLAMTTPDRGEMRAATREEGKRAGQISKKVGQEKVWKCEQKHPEAQQYAQQQQAGMQQMMQNMGGMAQQAQQKMAGASGMTEAAGKQPTLAAAMATLGQAIRDVGGKFRLDLYMDQHYDDAAAQMHGPKRLQVVQASLARVLGDPALAPEPGKVSRDPDPRLEIVRVK